MNSWLAVLGALLLAAAIVVVKSETVQREIAGLFSDGDDTPAFSLKPSGAPTPATCRPGGLLSGNCAQEQRAGRFVVQVPIEIGNGGLVLPASRRVLRDSHVIDKIANDLNAMLVLPRDIPVKLQHCGFENAQYSLDTQDITICDEWIDKLGRAFAGIEDDEQFVRVVLAAAAFVFGHEVGHALIDQFDVGFTGREEDVADQFAVYLLAGTPTGAQQVLAGAEAFGRFADEFNGIAWDEHSFNDQRYFNILCWSYGSNPAAYPVVLTDGHLPLRRAERCPDEYRKMAAGFDQLLEPHRPAKKPILTRLK